MSIRHQSDARLKQLRDDVARWTAVGVIRAEQAEAIVRTEAESESGPPVGAGSSSVGRLPITAELMSYLGIVLLTVSGSVLVNRFWSDLRVGGRVAIGIVVAIVGLLGGLAIRRVDDSGGRRLSEFLWLCGTGGVAMASGAFADSAGRQNAHVTLFIVGVAVVTTSTSLWRNREMPLQFLSTVAGVCLTFAGFSLIAGITLTPMEIGFLIGGASLVFGICGIADLLHPQLLALAIAEIGLIVGGLFIAGGHRAFGLALGLAVTGASVGLGLIARQHMVVVVPLGIIGFLIFLARTLGAYSQGPVAVVCVFIAGGTLVAGSVWVGLRRSRSRIGSNAEDSNRSST